MISYTTYKLIHLIGILLLFLALGARVHQTAPAAPDRESGTPPRRAAMLLGMTHGLGLFLILLGGFGLMARLGIAHGFAWPGWVWGKFAIWLALGGLLALPLRVPALARPLWLVVPLLGAAAAYLAIFKPI